MHGWPRKRAGEKSADFESDLTHENGKQCCVSVGLKVRQARELCSEQGANLWRRGENGARGSAESQAVAGGVGKVGRPSGRAKWEGQTGRGPELAEALPKDRTPHPAWTNRKPPVT